MTDLQATPGGLAANRMPLAAWLLRLSTTREPLPSDFCAGLDDAAWKAALVRLSQHRLQPLMHWRLTHEHAHVVVPVFVSEALQRAFRKATLRSLTLQGDLHQVHRILQAAQIPHIVLKGAFLARHVYPHPALRPMRDLDLVVPLSSALPAFELLLNNGCTRSPQYPGHPQAFLDGGKHVPGIFAPSGKTLVEVHGRLVYPDDVGQAASDSLDEEAIWARRMSLAEGEESIVYMSPTDSLLHLIVHAAYDHRFENGPLILSDLSYLIERHAIDWPLLWTLAATGGWTRGCQLLLRVIEKFCALRPGVRIDLGTLDSAVAAELDALVDTTAALMFRDGSSPIDQETLGAIDVADGVLGRAGLLWRKAFPSRRSIAAQFPVDPRSPAIVVGYVRRWWYVTRRAVEIRRTLAATSAEERGARQAERLQVESLDRWLQDD